MEGFLAASVSWYRRIQIWPYLYILRWHCTWTIRQKRLRFILTCSYLSADIVSTVEFNHDGELLATGDKGGRIVIFQKEEAVSFESTVITRFHEVLMCFRNVFQF